MATRSCKGCRRRAPAQEFLRLSLGVDAVLATPAVDGRAGAARRGMRRTEAERALGAPLLGAARGRGVVVCPTLRCTTAALRQRRLGFPASVEPAALLEQAAATARCWSVRRAEGLHRRGLAVAGDGRVAALQALIERLDEVERGRTGHRSAKLPAKGERETRP